MKAGIIIKLSHGREGTVVYNGLDGVGIKWGVHKIDVEDVDVGNPLFGDPPTDYKWFPDAMLRDAYRGCDSTMEYVGDEYEVIHPSSLRHRA